MGYSGKGRSFVSVRVSPSLYASSVTARVGIFDVDLTCTSIVPHMLGLDGHGTRQGSGAWVPVYADAHGDGEHICLCMSVRF